MSTPALASPSFADVWNQILAPKFIRFRKVLISGALPHGRKALALYPPQAGEAAVDIGCGFGDTTLELAELVGQSGSALGLDVVPAFLDFGRAALHRSRMSHVQFASADAETLDAPQSADLLFARFGTMFFGRPLTAFRNLRRMLRAEGRLVMTTWRQLEDNPWLGVAKRVVQQRLPRLGDDAVSCGPGPFSLASPELVRELLERAGFRDITLVPSDALTTVGRTLSEAVDFQMALGPAGEIVREAGAFGEAQLVSIREAIARALEPYQCEQGVVMPSGAWIVHAR